MEDNIMLLCSYSINNVVFMVDAMFTFSIFDFPNITLKPEDVVATFGGRFECKIAQWRQPKWMWPKFGKPYNLAGMVSENIILNLEDGVATFGRRFGRRIANGDGASVAKSSVEHPPRSEKCCSMKP